MVTTSIPQEGLLTEAHESAPSTAASQFNELAGLYEEMALWPFRKDIEIPSVLYHLGDLTGRDVLDFGCGSGFYARMLKARGARRVVGYDEADGMMRYARRREEKERVGIEFTSDLSASLHGQFDIVLSVYVLPYATTRDALHDMCASMARLLRPGGRLVALPIHPDYEIEPDYYRPCGFNLSSETPYVEGSPVQLDLMCGQGEASVTAWYWSASALETALRAAGLGTIHWHDPKPLGSTAARDAPETLRPYILRPHAVIIDCQKE
ncbi:class I SAM-dependent methyltransferase [Chondromyces crocatus]|uniref:SAM-dependent methyltransferase n=1 Tax=Chondromyces crocatus TaxID=52 RepID=A0A0K1EN64_CHOCO|nr:class I SAM-dependent methyltransferase [Chondromyces crocatus]AKT42057.1 SAM-dependent methyltransferase [Chondromyces crocatus]